MTQKFDGTKLVLEYKSNPSKDGLARILAQYGAMLNQCSQKIISKSNELEGLREDIIQHGRIGLLVAIEKYDESVAKSFTTIAYPYVWGYMMHYTRTEPRWNTGVKIPSHALSKLNDVYMSYALEEQRLQRKPTLEELLYLNSHVSPHLCMLAKSNTEYRQYYDKGSDHCEDDSSQSYNSFVYDNIESRELVANIHLLEKQGYTMAKICKILGIKNRKALQELISLHNML